MSFYLFMAILIVFSGANAYCEAQKKNFAKVTMSSLVLLAAILLSIFKVVTTPVFP